MAKRGRPKASKTDPTSLIRAKDETAHLLTLVAEVQGLTVAALVELLLRDRLNERYATVYPLLLQNKAAKDAAAVESGGEASPDLPNPLVTHPETGELVPVAELHSPVPKKKPKS